MAVLRSRYFEAPEAELWLRDAICRACSKEGPCFPGAPGGGSVCPECLTNERASLSHETELGTLEDGRLSKFDPDGFLGDGDGVVERPPPPGFSRPALRDLGFAPPFVCHQGDAIYLVHCNDFMAYLGRWEPEDFEREAAGRDPRKVYAALDGDPELWDDTKGEMAKYGDRWPAYVGSRWAFGSWVYVFRCLHCDRKRSWWNCG